MEEMKIKVLDENKDSIKEEECRVDKKVVCSCDSERFKVYQGYYRTIIECLSCGKKYCVHDG